MKKINILGSMRRVQVASARRRFNSPKVDLDQLEKAVERAERRELQDGDAALFRGAFERLDFLNDKVNHYAQRAKRLRSKIARRRRAAPPLRQAKPLPRD